MGWLTETVRRIGRLSGYPARPPGRDERDENGLSPGERKNRQYDRETVEVMTCCLEHDSLCVDGGAHHGSILGHMFRIAPGGRHFAFEPLPHLARKLEKRFPDARVRQAALGSRAATSVFHFVENDPGYSGLQQREYDRPDPVITELDVEVVRLDDVIDESERPRFIKLDLEGGEYDALRGASRVIEASRPIVVFEAGERSSGRYGVSPDMIFDLFDDRFAYRLSTMERWLGDEPAFSRQAFLDAYGREFFFIATPK
jgi:FkbM family methyltransferase